MLVALSLVVRCLSHNSDHVFAAAAGEALPFEGPVSLLAGLLHPLWVNSLEHGVMA